jgi:hypothetical protein
MSDCNMTFVLGRSVFIIFPSFNLLIFQPQVPYDPVGLEAALKAAGINASDVIEQVNDDSNVAFHAGSYGSPIHEQMEMVTNCWGQWAINNQPVWALQAMGLGMAESLTSSGMASRAQAALRRSLNLFRPTASMYPGDEDNGSMGAWYACLARENFVHKHNNTDSPPMRFLVLSASTLASSFFLPHINVLIFSSSKRRVKT